MPKLYHINDWLHDLETRTTQEIQLGLTRVMAVAQKLQLHQPGCPVITVGGTNGKGSTVTALETIYHVAGYHVGAYTSPHLLQFNERIRVDLTPISDDNLCQAFSIIDDAREETILTYFEMTTLAALWYFKKMSLDVVILEVGLGGRLDATNIIDADLSIITTIDFDHQEYLGNTLEKIGYEKAGILRQGKPFIYADINPPRTITEAAEKLAAPAYFFGKEFSIQEQGDVWSLHFAHPMSRDLSAGSMNLAGSMHPAEKPRDIARGKQLQKINELSKPTIQLKSAAAALTACFLLEQYLPVELAHMHTAMQRIFIPGRLQMYEGTVNVLCDVSHNPQSARLLADTLRMWKHLYPTSGLSPGSIDGESILYPVDKPRDIGCSENLEKKPTKVHAVFSALKDKDIFGLILPLKDCVDYWYPAQLHNKRAPDADLLLEYFKDAEISVNICYNSPFAAFEKALNQAEPGDLIVVYGSFFTVSHVMAAMPNRRFNETSN